jgi:ABC-2 type transport system ATP-binding protein
MKRRVGYVSPVMLYWHWKRVGLAIEFVRGFHPTWDQTYCDHLLRTFALTMADRIALLSFGARMKFSLVLALSWRPPVLILDEPTTGLDPIARRQMFAELLAAVQDDSRTVLVSSHAVSDLERVADHVGMLQHGRLVFEGATTAVTERFRLVDFTLDVPGWTPLPGIVVQRTDQGRWRVVVDGQRSSTNDLRALGAVDITESRLSLEELFIALGQK